MPIFDGFVKKSQFRVISTSGRNFNPYNMPETYRFIPLVEMTKMLSPTFYDSITYRLDQFMVPLLITTRGDYVISWVLIDIPGRADY